MRFISLILFPFILLHGLKPSRIGPEISAVNLRKVLSTGVASIVCVGICFCPVQEPTFARSAISYDVKRAASSVFSKPSPGWEMARQKRTAAIKVMEEKGIVHVQTDESGNQFLSFPWFPDKKIPYKSLSISQRLQSEVFAGAFGEFAKDIILHPVDTMKTRRQAKKRVEDGNNTASDMLPNVSPLLSLKGRYLYIT